MTKVLTYLIGVWLDLCLYIEHYLFYSIYRYCVGGYLILPTYQKAKTTIKYYLEYDDY